MADMASIIQTVDDYIRDDFKVSVGLENLFRGNPKDQQNQNATPTRQHQLLDWTVFGCLTAAFIAYTTDIPYAGSVVPWDDPLFDEVRVALQGTDLNASESVNYDMSIPQLRVYREYTQIVKELEIRPHPLEIALLNVNTTFTPSAQGEIRRAFQEAFLAACRFRQIHTECMMPNPKLWEELAQAETHLQATIATLTEEKEEVMGDQFDGLTYEELERRGPMLTAQGSEIKRKLKELRASFDQMKAEDTKLDSKLAPLQKRVAELRDGINTFERELERRSTLPVVTEADVDRVKEKLNILQERDNTFRQEVNTLEDKIRELRSEEQGAENLLKECLHPFSEYIRTVVVPTTMNYHKKCQDATALQAQTGSDQANTQNQDRIWKAEIAQLQSDIELAENDCRRKNEELRTLRLRNSLLKSPDHMQENALKQQSLELARQCATQEMGFRRQMDSKFERQSAEAEALSAEYDRFLDQLKIDQALYAQRNAGELLMAIKSVTDRLTQLT